MNTRYLICVPVYNNPKTILSVVQDIRSQTDNSILVVDDGSDVPVQEIFKNCEKIDKVDILRLQKNCGKGVAIQCAIEFAVCKGYTHLLTMDADGQHSATDIAKLLQSSSSNPWAVVIGDRNMDTLNVPKSSIFGKAFSNFWIQYETEVQVADSQSGFRVYPLFFVQNMNFVCKRYDFEIEILTRLIWKNVQVLSVPITVKYFPSETRISHFHKFKDNFRISVINTVLVILSLLNRKQSPLKSSFSLAIGVFVGMTPFFGMHTFIVTVIALLFRFNLIYMWLGTQVSIPPLVPFIFLFVNATRLHLFGETSTVFSWFISYAVSGVVLASCVGLLSFSVLYRKNKLKNRPRYFQAGRVHLGIKILNFILSKFGLRAAYFCLNFVIPFYYLFNFKSRKSLSEYWKIIDPKIGFFLLQKKMLLSYKKFAEQIIDRELQKKSSESVFKFNLNFSLEESRKILNANRGMISVNGHYGGWDLAATVLREHFSDKTLRAVMHQENAAFQPTAQAQNKNYEVTYFNKESFSLMKVKNDLELGQCVALMVDRPVGKNYELVPFFGKLAVFDTTPFKVALSCQAPYAFVFCFKEKYKEYSIHIRHFQAEESTQLDFFAKEQKILQILKSYVACLEAELRKYPEQWYNFFPFWSQLVIN